jgi:hypothetical protein
MIESTAIFIILAIFIVAVLYSSVGHGGASGYLAVMAFFSIAPTVTRPTALLLNVFVASIAFFQFERRIDRELDNSRYDERRREDRLNQLARDFANATESLDNEYDNRRDYNDIARNVF